MVVVVVVVVAAGAAVAGAAVVFVAAAGVPPLVADVDVMVVFRLDPKRPLAPRSRLARPKRLLEYVYAADASNCTLA